MEQACLAAVNEL